MVALVMVIAVLAVLANAPLVHGQSVVALFVDENGNVGIGTMNPNATLDVAGNAIVTGTIVADKIGIGTAYWAELHLMRRAPDLLTGNAIATDISTLINPIGNVGIGTETRSACCKLELIQVLLHQFLLPY